MRIFDAFKKNQKKEKKVIRKPEVAREKKSEVTLEKKTSVKKEGIGKTVGILIKPLITEKTSFLGQYGQYVFEVDPKANKIEIAKAIFNAYGVKPISVNIVQVRGKEIRYGRTHGRTKDKKKAIITLKPDEKIEVHEGV